MLLPNLIVLSDAREYVGPLAPPLIPVDIFLHERLRVVPDSLNGRAVGCRRTLPPTARAFVQQVAFALIPHFAQAILAYEFIASVIKIFQTLINVWTKQTMFVVHYWARALVTLFTFNLNIEWNQRLLPLTCSSFYFQLERAHRRNSWWNDCWWRENHTSDVENL